MSKSLREKRVKCLTNRLTLHYSFIQNDSVETHAHGVYENSFIICSRRSLTNVWVLDIISSEIVKFEIIQGIKILVESVLRLEIDLFSQVEIGNQSILFSSNMPIYVILEESKSFISFTIHVNNIVLKCIFNFRCHVHISNLMSWIIQVREQVSLLLELNRRNMLNYQMYNTLRFINLVKIHKDSDQSFSLNFIGIGQCKSFIEFIAQIYVDDYYLTDLQVSVDQMNQISDFRAMCNFKMKNVIKFPKTRIGVKKLTSWTGGYELQISYGRLNVGIIGRDSLNNSDLKKFNFMLNLLYKIVGKDNVSDILTKQKLLVS